MLAILGLVLSLFPTLSHACIPVKTPTPGIPAIPACKKCDDSLVTPNPNSFLKFDSVSTDTTGACAVRTFVCPGDFVVQPNGNAYSVVTNGKVVYALNCNADGTAWLQAGTTTVIAGMLNCGKN